MLQERVLHYLEQHIDDVVTGGQMAKLFGVSRTAVWKAVHTLQEQGYRIENIPNRGYRLTGDKDGLSTVKINRYLLAKRFGRSMEMLETVGSTNTYLKGLDTAALPEGHVVLADGQTGGRGRLGRTFFSPTKEGIYLSVLLKPEIGLQEVSQLTLCAAVAACRAIEVVCRISPEVKWVNDLFYNGKKLGGILTEGIISAETQTIGDVIVGIGINMGMVPAEVFHLATSLYEITGETGWRNSLIAELLNQLELVYERFCDANQRSGVLAEYEQRLFILGCKVDVVQYGEAFCGIATGIDATGALLVVDEAGDVHTVGTGEVRFSEKSAV